MTMNYDTILLLLLVSIGAVLGAVAHALFRIKWVEDDILSDKTKHQVRLMSRHSQLSALEEN